MINSSLGFVALPGAALLGLGLSHANLSSSTPSPACAPAGETAAAAGLVFGDVDGDGLDDAFALGAEGQARLFMNFGQGRFEDVTLAANLGELGGASCALFADLDGDGRVDLFTGSSATRLWRNLGNGTFEPMPSRIEHDLVDLAARAVDHDQDGRLDLEIHTEAGDLVYRNLGEGRFERVALPLGDLAQAPAHVGWIAPDAVDVTDPLAAPDASTPAQRRLGRWVEGRAAGAFASTTTGAPSGASSFGPSLPFLATCQPGVRDANGGACLGASSVPELGKLYPLSTALNVDGSGRVGLGTTTPSETLHVKTHSGVNDSVDYALKLENDDFGNTTTGMAFSVEGLTLDYAKAGIAFQRTSSFARGKLHFLNNGAATTGEVGLADARMTIDQNGSVGIGTTAPDSDFALDIEDIGTGVNWRGSVAAGGSSGQKVVLGQLNGVATIGAHNGALNAWTNLDLAGEDIAFKWNNGPGNVVRMSIDGSSGLVSVKQSLEIRGGADIVERFESSCGPLEPGTVVAIDPESPGQLACSFAAYDTKVAGVVSGAGGVKPGLSLGQDGHLEGETPVAMTGRVYVKCSTENGAIRPGDRLTSAALAGHAMKVTDSARADGAVIGKAMSSLDEGTGLVLVLVNLQ